ncbi:MAG: hypothetical protein Q4P13_09680 [Psychrobacter sp.]|nr:hypothetical protein [Psychrobacter sp.]
MNYHNQNCYEFWGLAKSLRINDIVALWCGVEPSQFNHFVQQSGYAPSCADAKKVVIEDALISGELNYIDEGLPYDNGKIWLGGDTEELIRKNRLRINKEALQAWFITKYEQGHLSEIPIFLDKEKQLAQSLEADRLDAPLPIEDKSMDSRSRNSALKILYALLIKSSWANHAPTSNQVRGNANTEIELILNELGLNVSSETIGKFLKDVQILEKENPYSSLTKTDLDIPF